MVLTLNEVLTTTKKGDFVIKLIGAISLAGCIVPCGCKAGAMVMAGVATRRV